MSRFSILAERSGPPEELDVSPRRLVRSFTGPARSDR